MHLKLAPENANKKERKKSKDRNAVVVAATGNEFLEEVEMNEEIKQTSGDLRGKYILVIWTFLLLSLAVYVARNKLRTFTLQIVLHFVKWEFGKIINDRNEQLHLKKKTTMIYIVHFVWLIY